MPPLGLSKFVRKDGRGGSSGWFMVVVTATFLSLLKLISISSFYFREKWLTPKETAIAFLLNWKGWSRSYTIGVSTGLQVFILVKVY